MGRTIFVGDVSFATTAAGLQGRIPDVSEARERSSRDGGNRARGGFGGHRNH